MNCQFMNSELPRLKDSSGFHYCRRSFEPPVTGTRGLSGWNAKLSLYLAQSRAEVYKSRISATHERKLVSRHHILFWDTSIRYKIIIYWVTIFVVLCLSLHVITVKTRTERNKILVTGFAISLIYPNMTQESQHTLTSCSKAKMAPKYWAKSNAIRHIRWKLML